MSLQTHTEFFVMAGLTGLVLAILIINAASVRFINYRVDTQNKRALKFANKPHKRKSL